MIEQFAIKNYKSFKELEIIDFTNNSNLPEKASKHLRIKNKNSGYINRVNFIYGKNGSGKSTIAEALSAFQSLACFTGIPSEDFVKESVNGLSDNEQLAFLENRRRQIIGMMFEKIAPFKLVENTDPEIFMLLVFSFEGYRYRYSLVIDSILNHIIEESLEVYENKKFNSVFIKECFEDKVQIKGDFSKVELDRFHSYYLEQSTLLSLMYKSVKVENEELAEHAFRVLLFLSQINFGFDKINKRDSLVLLEKESKVRSQIVEAIEKIDLSITDLEIESKTSEYEAFKSQRKYQGLDEDLVIRLFEKEKTEYNLKMKHGKFKLDFMEESSGTKVALDSLYSIYSASEKVWIIDDYENDLHEELALEFAKFVGSELVSQNQQFIFITHKSELLDVEELKYKPIHNLVVKDEKTLGSHVVNLSIFKDLRTDNRNSWKQFYKNFRLGQYPKITLNYRDLD